MNYTQIYIDLKTKNVQGQGYKCCKTIEGVFFNIIWLMYQN